MMFPNDADQARLALVGGVIQAQRLVVPPQVVMGIKSYRHACRLAWKLRQVRNLTRRSLAEQCGLYTSHVSDYFSMHEHRRELPARHVAAVERVLGNAVISQWLAQQAQLTVLEEMQAARRAA
jgi:DNA-binding transcriptional regulator YdaS (Cro superfamily)